MERSQFGRQVAYVCAGVLDVLYPPVCFVCGARQEAALCPVCLASFKPIHPPYCDRCGVPVEAGRLVCPTCEAGAEPPFAWSHAMGEYVGTLRRAIHRLKYDGRTALALPLGQALAKSLRTAPYLLPPDEPSFDLLVPIPLHPLKRRQRGFNQAELIARAVASEFGGQLDAQGLRRVKYTRTQTNLAHADRTRNLQNAFAASAPLYFHGKSVLLLDDVLTTTATLREAARVVREAGARRVCVAALASGG
jgi:ComF family protein